MNERKFRSNVLAVILFYVLVIVVGISIRIAWPDENSIIYGTFKDLIPLIIATPAAWLGYCFQRRQAFLKDVRDLWSKLVTAVQEAIQYTHLQDRTQSEFAKVQKSLSSVIDELRSVFLNLEYDTENIGLFPFESLKKIHDSISSLGFGENANEESAKRARTNIVSDWKKLREHFLSECARGLPIKPDSPYLK